MSYQVKRSIVSVLAGILILVVYGIYAFGRIQSGTIPPDELNFWATAILTSIGIGIVVLIVIQIIFHILLSIAMAVKMQVQSDKCDDKEMEKTLELEMVEDEMDKLIELKSMRINFAIVGIGFIAALVTLVLNYSPAVMLNILFYSFGIGSVMGGIAQLYLYCKGVKNA